jgi:hypothetical protein
MFHALTLIQFSFSNYNNPLSYLSQNYLRNHLRVLSMFKVLIMMEFKILGDRHFFHTIVSTTFVSGIYISCLDYNSISFNQLHQPIAIFVVKISKELFTRVIHV